MVESVFLFIQAIEPTNLQRDAVFRLFYVTVRLIGCSAVRGDDESLRFEFHRP